MSTVHDGLLNSATLDYRTLQRALTALLPDARSAGTEGALELHPSPTEPPRLTSAKVIEGTRMERHAVSLSGGRPFRAFLDGAQRSKVILYDGTVPIVFGSVSAVVRERSERRMRTWNEPIRDARIYAPRALMRAVTWDTLQREYSSMLVDTSIGTRDAGAHPFALHDAARHQVQTHREQLEHRLATAWCESEAEPLFIDGGISGSECVARSGVGVGVVKSHLTLYAEGQALGVVLNLAQNERSSVFRIVPPKRTPVASWYLRLRETRGRDPLWGLVRVETAEPASDGRASLFARAEEVSAAILAEVSPLALPDARWDTMVYGIRDCEEYLRALQGT